MRCFECDEPALHQHHVVPESLGGTRTIPLCEACHGKVHDADLSTSGLVKAALLRNRLSGLVAGTIPYGFRAEDGRVVKNPVEYEVLTRVRLLGADGHTARQIASDLSSMGCVTRQGTRWETWDVRQVLRSLESTDPLLEDLDFEPDA
jgi:hypothetical protein